MGHGLRLSRQPRVAQDSRVPISPLQGSCNALPLTQGDASAYGLRSALGFPICAPLGRARPGCPRNSRMFQKQGAMLGCCLWDPGVLRGEAVWPGISIHLSSCYASTLRRSRSPPSRGRKDVGAPARVPWLRFSAATRPRPGRGCKRRNHGTQARADAGRTTSFHPYRAWALFGHVCGRFSTSPKAQVLAPPREDTFGNSGRLADSWALLGPGCAR